MKRICQLAIAFFWLTAPVVTFILLRCGAVGSYPFFAVFACIFRLLHRSTDTFFLFAVPVLFAVWIVILAACFWLGRRPSLKGYPGCMALLDLLLALRRPIASAVLLLDALVLLAVLYSCSRATLDLSGLRLRTRRSLPGE